MRKLLVKLFVLDYLFKGWNGNRGAFIVYPIALLYGLSLGYFDSVQWYLASALVAVTYFDFLHFVIWPATWTELDQSQKWQYGVAVKSGQLTKSAGYYTDIDWKEWEVINQEINKKFQ